MQAIANRLNLESIPRRVSSKTQCWRISTIEYILPNERYVGDSLWQKTYQTRDLPHRAKKNKGELEQYFLPDTHLPIIDRDTFLKAKQLRLSRKQCPARICKGDILRKRLRCGICGGPFRSIYGRNTHSYACQAKNRGSKRGAWPQLHLPGKRVPHHHLRRAGAGGERVHILPCQVGRSAVHAGRQGQHPAVLAATAGNTPSAVCCSAASAARPTAAWCGHSTARSAPCGAAAAVWITERNTVSIPPRWTKRRSNRQS